jgi:hypothetical protein
MLRILSIYPFKLNSSEETEQYGTQLSPPIREQRRKIRQNNSTIYLSKYLPLYSKYLRIQIPSSGISKTCKSSKTLCINDSRNHANVELVVKIPVHNLLSKIFVTSFVMRKYTVIGPKMGVSWDHTVYVTRTTICTVQRS